MRDAPKAQPTCFGLNPARLAAALALAVVVSLAALGCGSSAAPLDVASSVDLSRFQGKWYEIARLPRATQSDCNGTTAFYTQNSDGSLSLVNQCNLGSPTGPLYTVAMSATVPNAAVAAKLALDVGGYTGDYWILEVGSDYEYAVVGHPSRLYWWLLSRTPMLDESTTRGVLERATTAGFDMSQLQYTPQPPAGERNTLSTPQGPIPQGLSTGCAIAKGRANGERDRRSYIWSLVLIVAALRLRERTGAPRSSRAAIAA